MKPATLDRHEAAIIHLCRQFEVQRLELFGSATREDFDETTSDFDFFVEFVPQSKLSLFSGYFPLKHGLEDLLGRPVDLIVRAAVTDPHFLVAAERDRELIYAQ